MRKDEVMKEIQIEYEKYLKLYSKDSYATDKRKTTQKSSNMASDLIAFQKKWETFIHQNEIS